MKLTREEAIRLHRINDKDKERIKAFVKQIEAEWDAEEGDD